MKKKTLLCLLLTLALLTALTPAACADDTLQLGSYPLGQELELFIAWVEDGAPISSENLPEGLRLEPIVTEAGNGLSLVGTPTQAGRYRFRVEAGQLFNCELEITPPAPVLPAQQDVRCWVGDEITLNADSSVSGGANVRYQWYIGLGLIATPLEGQTAQQFHPDTARAGTYYYSYEIIQESGGVSARAMSDPIAVTVTEPSVVGIAIETKPTKTEYRVGEQMDAAGLSVRVRYDNGSSVVLTEGFSVTPSVFVSAGAQSVQILYAGMSCGFLVTVREKEPAVMGVGLLTPPKKTEYTVGDTLDTTGLSIRVYTDDGEYTDVREGMTCTPTRLTTAGTQTITVSYKEKTCTFSVTVKPERVVTGVSVLTLPTRRTYTVGDMIETAGLTLQLNTNQGVETVSSGYTVTPKVLATPGTQEITVIYGQFTTRFTVTVNAREAVSPTPRTSATPAPTPESTQTPATPASAAAPQPTQPVRKNTGVSAGVKFFFALAVLSLLGLAGYVWYLRRQGYAEDESAAQEQPDTPPHITADAPRREDSDRRQ